MPENLATELRQIFNCSSPEELGFSQASSDQPVWGIVYEKNLGTEDDPPSLTTATLICLADGHISIYFGQSAGVLGIGQNPEYRQYLQSAREKLFRSASENLASFQPVVEVMLSPLSFKQERLHFITFDGIRSSLVDSEELLARKDSTAEVYFAADELFGKLDGLLLKITGDEALGGDCEPVVKAIQNNDLKTVTDLIESAVDVNQPLEGGIPLLGVALAEHRIDIAEFLIQAGADVNATWPQEVENEDELIDALIDKSLDLPVDASDGDLKRTFDKIGDQNGLVKQQTINVPLICMAIGASQPKCYELLIAHGADLDARDGRGQTPLLFAVSNNDSRAVAILIKNGVNLELCDPDQMTPLHLAVLEGYNKCASLLIEAGANLEARDDGHATPLLLAVEEGEVKCAKMLVEAGADISARDEEDFPVLTLAVISENPKMVKFLLRAGADPSAPDGDGETPLEAAESEGLTKIARLIRGA